METTNFEIVCLLHLTFAGSTDLGVTNPFIYKIVKWLDAVFE